MSKYSYRYYPILFVTYTICQNYITGMTQFFELEKNMRQLFNQLWDLLEFQLTRNPTSKDMLDAIEKSWNQQNLDADQSHQEWLRNMVDRVVDARRKSRQRQQAGAVGNVRKRKRAQVEEDQEDESRPSLLSSSSSLFSSSSPSSSPSSSSYSCSSSSCSSSSSSSSSHRPSPYTADRVDDVAEEEEEDEEAEGEENEEAEGKEKEGEEKEDEEEQASRSKARTRTCTVNGTRSRRKRFQQVPFGSGRNSRHTKCRIRVQEQDSKLDSLWLTAFDKASQIDTIADRLFSLFNVESGCPPPYDVLRNTMFAARTAWSNSQSDKACSLLRVLLVSCCAIVLGTDRIVPPPRELDQLRKRLCGDPNAQQVKTICPNARSLYDPYMSPPPCARSLYNKLTFPKALSPFPQYILDQRKTKKGQHLIEGDYYPSRAKVIGFSMYEANRNFDVKPRSGMGFGLVTRTDVKKGEAITYYDGVPLTKDLSNQSCFPGEESHFYNGIELEGEGKMMLNSKSLWPTDLECGAGGFLNSAHDKKLANVVAVTVSFQSLYIRAECPVGCPKRALVFFAKEDIQANTELLWYYKSGSLNSCVHAFLTSENIFPKGSVVHTWMQKHTSKDEFYKNFFPGLKCPVNWIDDE